MRRMKEKEEGSDLTKTILVDGARMKDKSVHDVKAKNVENNPNKKKKSSFFFLPFFSKVNVCVCLCVWTKEKMLLNGGV